MNGTKAVQGDAPGRPPSDLRRRSDAGVMSADDWRGEDEARRLGVDIHTGFEWPTDGLKTKRSSVR